MSDITQVLQAVERGESKTSEDLLPLVYDELRRLAAARMAQEAAGQTLQPTALVHEAWLQLVGEGDRSWQNRAHFFGAAAHARVEISRRTSADATGDAGRAGQRAFRLLRRLDQVSGDVCPQIGRTKIARRADVFYQQIEPLFAFNLMKLKLTPLSSITSGLLLLTALCASSGTMRRDMTAIVDTITFGDSASEASHVFTANHSEIISGGLGEPARILLPQTDPAWEGGRLAFTLKVDPQKQNYATVRLWGSDTTHNQLVLFCEGKQIGYRHLGDIDILDIGGEEAAFSGRFIYNTTPLPLALTQGKTNLNLEIRSYGPTWGYTGDFEKFQKPLVGPTRGIYKIYSHTDGCFVPPAIEKQGDSKQNPPIRQKPGAEVLEKLKARVNGEVNNLLKSAKPLNEMQMQFLARAYFVKWTLAFQNSNVVGQVLKGLDGLAGAYQNNPSLAEHDPATPNPGWFEFGPAGEAISLLAAPLQPFLDGQIDDLKISRRVAYSRMLQAGRDWHRKHRRLYTNQTMITDMNIYLSNRGLEVVDLANALSESAVRRYLYEAVGLEPWRDSDPGGDAAPETNGRGWNAGTNYLEITAKGLTKELGYVGYYGEVLDWVTSIYEATRPAPGQPGDEKIKLQLEKIAGARAVFRYPGTDSDGFRAMRIEAVVGWRDSGHYPGNVAYAERPTWDASPLYAVADTLDPQAVGYAQQMFDDNQFFISLERQIAENNSLRVTAGLLGVPDQYEIINSQMPSPKRLPMTPSQPDFVFSDEEDGVLAVKNGDEMLYASLYWRSRNAVNSLARVHFTTPRTDQIAVVCEDVQFEPSGQFYTRPDWTTFGFGNGGPRYPQNFHSAHAGERLPVAKVPTDVSFRPGDENVHVGKAEFYTLRYGKYLIGMNMTKDKTFQLKMPSDVFEAKELVSGKVLKLSIPIIVQPRSTKVFWEGSGGN